MNQPRKLEPKTARESPMAAAILGTILVRNGLQEGSSSSVQAGRQLLQLAWDNSEQMPTPQQARELRLAIEQAMAALGLPQGLPMQAEPRHQQTHVPQTPEAFERALSKTHPLRN